MRCVYAATKELGAMASGHLVGVSRGAERVPFGGADDVSSGVAGSDWVGAVSERGGRVVP